MTDDDLIRMIRSLDTPPDWAQVRARLEREWLKEHGRFRKRERAPPPA